MTRFRDWEGDEQADVPKFGRSDSFDAPDPFAFPVESRTEPAPSASDGPVLRVVPQPPADLPKSITGDLEAAAAALKYSQDEEWAANFDNELRALVLAFTEEYRRRRDAEFRQLERMQSRLRERTGIAPLTPMDDTFLFMEAQRGERMTGKEKAHHVFAILKASGDAGIKAVDLGRRIGEAPARYVKMLPQEVVRRDGELLHMRYFWTGKEL